MMNYPFGSKKFKKRYLILLLCSSTITDYALAAQQPLNAVPKSTASNAITVVRDGINTELAKQQTMNTELYAADLLKADKTAFTSQSAFASAWGWAPGDNLGSATAADVSSLFKGTGDCLKSDGTKGDCGTGVNQTATTTPSATFGSYTSTNVQALTQEIDTALRALISAGGANLAVENTWTAIQNFGAGFTAEGVEIIISDPSDIKFGADNWLDDTKGDGDSNYLWSADKIFDMLASKEPADANIIKVSEIDSLAEFEELLGWTPGGSVAVLTADPANPADDYLWINKTDHTFNWADSGGLNKIAATHTAWDTSPAEFSFTNATNVSADGSAQCDATPITVLGINRSAVISAAGDTGAGYKINTGSFQTSAGTVVLNDVIYPCVNNPSAPSGVTSVTVTIGGVSDDYTRTASASAGNIDLGYPTQSTTPSIIAISPGQAPGATWIPSANSTIKEITVYNKGAMSTSGIIAAKIVEANLDAWSSISPLGESDLKSVANLSDGEAVVIPFTTGVAVTEGTRYCVYLTKSDGTYIPNTLMQVGYNSVTGMNPLKWARWTISTGAQSTGNYGGINMIIKGTQP